MALLQFDCKKGGAKPDVVQSAGSAISGAVRLTIDPTAAGRKRHALHALESIRQAIVQAPWQAGSGGGAFPTIVGPVIALFGDSITAFGNLQQDISGVTITRSAGAMSGTKSNTMFGFPEVYLQNINDLTYEVVGRNTFVSTTFSVSTASGASDTSTGATAAATQFGRFTPRGVYSQLLSMFKGGIDFSGNYGHPGGLASAMGPQITYGLSRTPTLAILMAGVNDAKVGGATGASVRASVKVLIDQIVAAGVPLMVLAITPLGTGFTAITENVIGDPNSATITTSANYLLKADCAALPGKVLWVDAFSDLVDKSGGTGNWVLFNSMTPDQIHPRTNAAILIATRAYAAMTPYISGPELLPITSTDAGSPLGHARFILRGPWVATTGGTFGGGGSGTLPPGWFASRGTGTTNTVVCSIVDPGDGRGFKVQAVCTPTAAGDTMPINLFNSATLASLGLVIGDEIAVGVEVDYSNATASGMGNLKLQLSSNTGGAFGYASSGELVTPEPSGTIPDSRTGHIMMTGWLKITSASFTALSAGVVPEFLNAPGPAATVLIRRATLFKR